MKAAALLANSLWLATSGRQALRFRRALAQPEAAQAAWLRAQLRRHAASTYGRAHGFDAIGDIHAFRRRVPLTDYRSLEPHIRRIRAGATDVLCCGPVSHLAPTSGSTGAAKLIPFSRDLQRGFQAAIAPWLCDLTRQRPRLIAGPCYWAISPNMALDRPSQLGAQDVTVGYEDDADYLGGTTAWLVRQTLAVPGPVRQVRNLNDFWFLTLHALLGERDLRLISVWHPSYVELLLEAAERHWHDLLEALASGHNPHLACLPPAAARHWRTRPAARRAAALRRIGPFDWARWWPRLQVLSCWGEQAAEPGWLRLRRALPGVLVQAKGLLATEAVVTLPLAGRKPLAVTSHFFEFLDERGDLRLAHQLERGQSYEVVVSNGGGLWRYRLGDLVECDGHLHATPSLRFLGRTGRVSDLRGEKLSEAFVYQALLSIRPAAGPHTFAALAARDRAGQAHYQLLIGAACDRAELDAMAARLDLALSENPHYALARRLGQLGPVRARRAPADADLRQLLTHGGRLGDAKPQVLITTSRGSPPTRAEHG